MSDLYSPYDTYNHDLRVWLGPARGDLDESAITGSWVPGAGWTDLSATVQRGSVVIEHDGTGFTARFTVEDEARDTWADDLAVAFVARFWSGGAYTAWETICWGYLDGSDRQRLGWGLRQTGERFVTYHGYWDRVNVPALRLGRRNLADGASIHASSAALATPDAEAPLEYISQDDCAASKIIDQNADTCAVLAVVADPARPTLGDTERPKFLRIWTDETGTPALEVWCGHNQTPWGDFSVPASVPNLFESGSNTRDDDAAKVEYSGSMMIVTAKQNVGNPYQQHGPQWNISCGDRPVRVAFQYRADPGDPGSIGKAIHITHDTAASVTLGADWRDYLYAADKATNLHDILVLRFQGGDNNNADSNLSTQTKFNIRNLRVSVGYSDLYFQKNDSGYKLSLANDNGAGTEAVVRIAGNIAPWEDWRIPADDSVILAYNPAAFRAKYDPGHRAVYALRNAMPSFSLRPPTHGTRVKLCYAATAVRDDYDDASITTVQEIVGDVANGGVAWSSTQALSRQSPLGTGTLTIENYPRVGLYPDTLGTGYWWVSLPAYQPAYLTQPALSGATKVVVSDPGEFPPSGSAYIAGDEFSYTGKDDHTLTGCTGISGDKLAGALVYPKVGGAQQSGWLVDAIELRRKPGTPTILAGAVIYSNAGSPSDPSTPDGSGRLWERQPDWALAARWDYGETGGIATIAIPLPGGYAQMRHVCVVVDRMARDSTGTVAQRAKLNELVVWQYRPGAGAGDWSDTGQGAIADAAAHLLATYGPVPAAKITVADRGALLGDVPLAPAKLGRDLAALCAGGLLTVACDNLNAVTVEPDPASTRFTRAGVALTLTESVALGEVEATWATAHATAQVRLMARDVTTFRTHTVNYPTRAATLGEIAEVKDVHVRSAQEARDLAEALFRARNARRSYRATIGASPWLRARQRILVSIAALDPSGEHQGINTVVTRFRHRVADAGGMLVWISEVELAEWAL